MFETIKSIATEKGQTWAECAAECGVSDKQLYRIANGSSAGSRAFWRKMIRWSDGRVTPDSFYADDISEVRGSA